MIHIYPFGVRRAVTASSSAAEFIEASLDPRDSRVDFAAFHLSLLVMTTSVVMMLMVSMIIILMISIGNHMRPSTINLKNLKTQVQLILNSTRSHGITCLSIKGKIYTKENHARSLFLSGKQRISNATD